MKVGIKYIFVIPAVLIFLFFSLFPTVLNIYLSFTNANVFNYYSPDWIWFENYYKLLISPGLFWQSMKVTILYLLIVIPAEAFLGIAYALLVNSLTKYRRIVVTFILLPMSIVPVFLGALGRLLFHNIVGIVPYYLRLLGFPPPSLSDPIQALFIVAIMDIWQWTPFVFIIILAGLTSLPLSVIDAAKIDGAEGWKEFRYITFPMLKRVIAVALIFRIMDACKTFDIPFMLIEGGPGAPVGATTTISILVYKFALTYNNIGIAAASSILLLIILSIAISIIVRQIWRE